MTHDIVFSRLALSDVLPDVRKHVAGVKLREAWVWKCGEDHWEFHYGDYYWHGSADNAFDARARGWSAYLAKLGVEGYAV